WHRQAEEAEEHERKGLLQAPVHGVIHSMHQTARARYRGLAFLVASRAEGSSMKRIVPILVLVLATATLGAWRLFRGADGGRGEALFYGRAWLDHPPASPTDRFHVFGTS